MVRKRGGKVNQSKYSRLFSRVARAFDIGARNLSRGFVVPAHGIRSSTDPVLGQRSTGEAKGAYEILTPEVKVSSPIGPRMVPPPQSRLQVVKSHRNRSGQKPSRLPITNAKVDMVMDDTNLTLADGFTFWVSLNISAGLDSFVPEENSSNALDNPLDVFILIDNMYVRPASHLCLLLLKCEQNVTITEIN